MIMVPPLLLSSRMIEACPHLCRVGLTLGADTLTFVGAILRSRTAPAAENLFPRKQLALYHDWRLRQNCGKFVVRTRIATRWSSRGSRRSRALALLGLPRLSERLQHAVPVGF